MNTEYLQSGLRFIDDCKVWLYEGICQFMLSFHKPVTLKFNETFTEINCGEIEMLEYSQDGLNNIFNVITFEGETYGFEQIGLDGLDWIARIIVSGDYQIV